MCREREILKGQCIREILLKDILDIVMKCVWNYY